MVSQQKKLKEALTDLKTGLRPNPQTGLFLPSELKCSMVDEFEPLSRSHSVLGSFFLFCLIMHGQTRQNECFKTVFVDLKSPVDERFSGSIDRCTIHSQTEVTAECNGQGAAFTKKNRNETIMCHIVA